jgi:hypothetical protein
MRFAFLFVLLGMAMGQDVPAIKVEAQLWECLRTNSDGCSVTDLAGKELDADTWFHSPEGAKFYYYRYSCADKSNVLLTAENGAKWCHRVQEEGKVHWSQSNIGNRNRLNLGEDEQPVNANVITITAPDEDAPGEDLVIGRRGYCKNTISLGSTTKRISDLFPEECAPPKPAK